MSRISFHFKTPAGAELQVVAGWDRPLGYYFMDIFDTECDDEDEALLWGCLHFDDVFKQTTTKRYEQVLCDRGIKTPDGFWEKVRMNEGNVWEEF